MILKGKLTKLGTGALALLMTPGFVEELQTAIQLVQVGGNATGVLVAAGKIITAVGVAYGAGRAGINYGEGLPRVRFSIEKRKAVQAFPVDGGPEGKREF